MGVKKVAFVSALRTAIGSYGGSLQHFSLGDLAAKIVSANRDAAQLADDGVDHVVFGNVMHSEPRDMYLARVAALQAGLSQTTPALTLNRLCGSGLQAIITGAQQIQLGLAQTVIAGGAESMSRVPYHLPTARFGQRMGNGQMLDPVLSALTCPFNHIHMGVTAENLADQFSISRELQDCCALASHQRAQAAIEKGYFSEQILPLEIQSKRGVKVFDTDEHVRGDVNLEKLQTLNPVFKEGGTVTAGNASGLNDGAAAVVMMETETALKQERNILGHLVDYAVSGVAPDIMGIGPVPAISEILARQKLSVNDIDLYEVNEAFAAQALAVAKQLELPEARLNPNGSGIALGHPVGATGAILVVKALHELNRTNGRFAMVSLCIGGGQGIAMLLEKPQ